jgi:hypothetical protein
MVPKASRTNYYTIDDAKTLVMDCEGREVWKSIL